MALVEAVLVYRPRGLGQEGAISLGATEDLGTIQTVGEQLLDDADEAAQMWCDVDPALAEIKRAEAERLRRVLELIVPSADGSPDLWLVE